MANEINTLNIGGSVYPIVPKEVELNSSLAAGNVVFTGINVATGKNGLNSTADLSYLLEKGVGTLVTPSIKTDIIKQSGSEYHITDSNGNILASFSSGGLSTTGVSVNSVPVSIEGHKHCKEDITNFPSIPAKLSQLTNDNNNVTGSGTSGYIAKFNGKNTITNGPAFGSAKTTYLRNDGNWATPPNTKVNVTKNTTTQAYLLAVTTAPTSTAAAQTAVSDTGVYLTAESGGLQATKMYAKSGFFEEEYSSSDERLKNFSDDIEINFDKLAKLRKKYFTWKDDDGKQHIGTSAQDIQEIYPELVAENTETGYLSVDYAKLSVIALAAIDKLVDKQKDLEERLERLEKMIK